MNVEYWARMIRAGGAEMNGDTVDVWTPEEIVQGIYDEAVDALAKQRCKARPMADPPEDCNWPFCGCDDHATKVLEVLSEMGIPE